MNKKQCVRAVNNSDIFLDPYVDNHAQTQAGPDMDAFLASVKNSDTPILTTGQFVIDAGERLWLDSLGTGPRGSR